VTILIKSTLKRQRPPAARIRASVRALLASARLRNCELSLLLVGDGTMRALNRCYRSKDRTTDVLSFPMREGKGPSPASRMLGDIVISVPEAERQARADGEPLSRVIDRLLVHGFLHLLGYDHERGGAEARRMEARERRLQEKLER
jgi:probable rRNA maturation factor